MNVLISAYAVSPNWGSEPGMGWNWIINIAKHCNVFVITEGEWKDEILEALEKLPQKDNIHFYFNPVSDKVRKMCWNQGDWRFYWYYARWQKKTLEIARQIIAEHKIDVMHQLNMIGFREPGYLWKIKNIPLVWGPVGGIANIPAAYLKGAGWKLNLFCRLKNFISDMQFRFHPRVRAAVKRSTMIAAMKEVQAATKKVYGKDIPVINETGTYTVLTDSENHLKKYNHDELKVLWVGRFIDTKRLDIALNAIAKTKNPGIVLTVCGTGTDEQVNRYKTLAKSLRIEQQVVWLGKVPHESIASLMAKSDLFLFTSIVEATSTVVLEAISASLPILSFNTCGFGPIVDNFAGLTLPLITPEISAEGFASQLNYFYNNRNRLTEISQQEKTNAHSLSWEYKGQQMSKIYRSVNRGGVIAWIPESYKNFNILWVGKFDFRKRLDIAIKAISLTRNHAIHLYICGTGSEQQINYYHKLTKELNVDSQVHFLGKVSHEKISEIMQKSDLFLMTSISDATSTVVVEAITENLPILSFDICGFGPIVKSFAGETIELTDPDQSAQEFADKINWLYNNPKQVAEISKKEAENKYTLSWDFKSTKITDIYKSIIYNKNISGR